MIGLLIGGTVVLCVGVLTIVFGIPIKEFSFGNTMILAGAVVACTGLLLLGLYLVGREFKNLARRLDSGLPVSSRDVAATTRGRTSTGVAPSKAARTPPSRAGADDMLFPRDQSVREFDGFSDELDHSASSLPPANAPSLSAPWQDEPPARGRSMSDADPIPGDSFDDMWRAESPAPRNGRGPSRSIEARSPRRGDAASVSIVKSGVVDSMAYSLYSDGSIEAQMPEGMVRFSSIDELRSHLNQRH